MLRSVLLVLAGNVTASFLSLLRNLVVARMLPIADFGIASTFAIAMAVVEMISTLGLQQQIIQSKDGDNPRFQAALQGFQVLRGVLSASLLLIIAAPIADFLNVPEATWAYRVMAIVPVLSAFGHFDTHRLTRGMRFGPLLMVGTIPPLVSLLAVWPLAVWLGDYRVMLVSILIQVTLDVLVSHLVAERPYALVIDRAIIARSISFGWPLLINNVFLFAVFNGDRLIVGRVLGMESLAILSMGLTLTLTPTLVLAKSMQNLYLPQIARAEGERLIHLAAVAMEIILVLGVLFVIAVMLLGGPFVEAALGLKYHELLPYLTPLAIMQGLRLFKVGPAIVALAVGRTGNALIGNVARLLALPAAAYLASVTGDLMTVIWIGLAAEAVGLVAALVVLLKRTLAYDITRVLLPHIGAITALLACGLYAVPVWGLGDSSREWIWVVVLLLTAFVQIVWTAPDLRKYVMRRRR